MEHIWSISLKSNPDDCNCFKSIMCLIDNKGPVTKEAAAMDAKCY